VFTDSSEPLPEYINDQDSPKSLLLLFCDEFLQPECTRAREIWDSLSEKIEEDIEIGYI
jgi:hypothetical protein